MNSSHVRYSHTFNRQFYCVSVLVTSLFGLAACSKNETPKTEDIRPVRVLQLAAQASTNQLEFSGEIKPRVEQRLSFRVGGKIVARKVEVGQTVARGQVLAQIDATDLKLAENANRAALDAAKIDLKQADADLKRTQDLRQKNFIAEAELERRQTAYNAAAARVQQAEAGFSAQSNQAQYSQLLADSAGVVTAIDAEVGQVVAAGTPVLRVALLGEKDVVIAMPENQVEMLKNAVRVEVGTNVGTSAESSTWLNAKIREIAPLADSATRTFLAKLAISNPPASLRLGQTAVARFTLAHSTALKVPLTALFQEKGQNQVWLVEAGKVKRVNVTVARLSGNEAELADAGLAGAQVVTAGAHLLKDGQLVKILADK